MATKNLWNASDCFFNHLARIEHQFLSGIRDSKKAASLWGMMRGVAGVRKSIHYSWLAKGLGLLCWGFKGVQEEILPDEASTLQIGSVPFPTGQYTSPPTPSLSQTIWPRWASRQFLSLPVVQTLLPVTFAKLRGCHYETIEEMKEAVTKVIDTLTQEDFHGAFQKLLETVQVHCSRRRLLRRGLEFHVCTINKSAHMKKVWKLF